jgi:hypothetical protein
MLVYNEIIQRLPGEYKLMMAFQTKLNTSYANWLSGRDCIWLNDVLVRDILLC